MRGIVVYDSYYGNTKLVAEAIAEQLKAEGHEVDLRSVRERYANPPQGDVLFLGSPIRMGSVTRRMKKYVRKLDKGTWKDKPAIVFTTILAQPENPTDKQKESREKYDIVAGIRFRDLAREEGLNGIEKHLWVDVKGMKGPLVESGIEKTRQFAHDALLSIGKN